MPSQPLIRAVGSIALDYLELPDGTKGETLGGSLTFFTLAARFFAPVQMVGIVGTDFPEEGWELFRQCEADLSRVAVAEGKTFRWGGRYHDDWEHRTTLFTELGVFGAFNPVLDGEANGCDLLYLGNIQPALQKQVLAGTPARRVMADTMNLWITTAKEEVREVIGRTDLFLINENEARLLGGTEDFMAAAKELLTLGPEGVIVKRGHLGSVWVTREGEVSVPAFKIARIADPTGAGDAFAGGLASRLVTGGTIADAMVWGSAVASLCVEGFGTTRLQSATRRDVEERAEAIRRRAKAF